MTAESKVPSKAVHWLHRLSRALLISGFLIGMTPSLQAEAAASGTTAAVTAANPKQTFIELLKAYRNYPEYFNLISNGAKTFDDIDPRLLSNLSEKVLQARYNQYNSDFVSYRKLEARFDEQLKIVRKRLDETPISDQRNRSDIEIKEKAMSARYKQMRRLVFLLSIDANTSILEALQTLPPEKRKAENLDKVVTKPRMPGVFGGARAERLKMSEAEKINLTPIDDEFYKTQLGQKVEKDLNGRAKYWSYDFDTDELYVMVGDEVSKVRVKQDSPGVRYIQTRVGAKFEDPRGSDTRVDMVKAQGRFLTGDKNDETLFGKFPLSAPKYEDALPPGHSANDGHNHSDH